MYEHDTLIAGDGRGLHDRDVGGQQTSVGSRISASSADAGCPGASSTATTRPVAGRTVLVRLCAVSAIGLAAALGPVKAYASATIFGTTPTTIDQQFGAAIRDHLTNLVREKGPEAAYHALWGLSSFQYYQMCRLYQSSHTGGSCFTLFPAVFGASAAHAAINRLVAVNVMYNQAIYATAIPGGRKAVLKDITIFGYPVQTTVSEVYTECVLATGDAAQGVVMFTKVAAPEVTTWFAGWYGFGTAVSWLIQTYDPALQQAIGDNIGALVDASVATASLLIQAEADQAIAAMDAIEGEASPGLNEADFDGLQLGAFDTGSL